MIRKTDVGFECIVCSVTAPDLEVLKAVSCKDTSGTMSETELSERELALKGDQLKKLQQLQDLQKQLASLEQLRKLQRSETPAPVSSRPGKTFTNLPISAWITKSFLTD